MYSQLRYAKREVCHNYFIYNFSLQNFKSFFFLFFFFSFFVLPFVEYGGSQASGLMGAVSHQPTPKPQQCQIQVTSLTLHHSSQQHQILKSQGSNPQPHGSQYICVMLLCQFWVYSKVNHIYIYTYTHTHFTYLCIHPFLFRSFSHIGYYTVLSYPVVYSRSLLPVCFIYGSMYMSNPNLLTCHSSPNFPTQNL